MTSTLVNLTRTPGSPACTLDKVDVAFPEPFMLHPPTVDCFSNEGCLCTGIPALANDLIDWTPVTKVVIQGSELRRQVCEETRTYLYLRINCPLDGLKQQKVQYEPEAYAESEGYTVYEEGDWAGFAEAPIKVDLQWTVRQNNTKLSPSDVDVRDYCKSDYESGAPTANRWFLAVLVALSGVVVLAAAIGYIVYGITVLARRKQAPKAEEEKELDAEAAKLQVDAPSTPKQELPAELESPSPTSLMGEVFHITYREGRNRWLTTFLVATAGLYIVGLIFEPRLRSTSAYERRVSPTLQGAVLSIVDSIALRSYGTFLERVARLLLTVMLCTVWGSAVFFSLLYNMSGHCRPLVLSIKAATSAAALALLDTGIILNLVASFSYRDRWTMAPAAFWFLFVAQIALLAVANVLAVWVFFTRAPDEQPERQPEPVAEGAEADAAAGPAYHQQTGSQHAAAAAASGADVDDSVPVAVKDVVGENTGNGSTEPGGKRDTEEEHPPQPGLMGKVKGAIAACASSLSEDASFRYSPWFIAPMIITLVLGIFFFIREIYILRDIQECLDLQYCPHWTKMNSALIPIISSILQPLLTGASPVSFVQHVSNALINSTAVDLLGSVNANFDYSNMTWYILDKSEALLPSTLTFTDAYTEQVDVAFFDQSVKPPRLVFNEEYRVRWRLGTENITAFSEEEVVNVTITSDGKLFLNGSTWAEWFLDSDEYAILCEAQEMPYKSSAVVEFLNDQARASYQNLVDSTSLGEKLNELAGSFGITPLDLVKQIYAVTIGPYVDGALCNNVTETVITPITQVQDVLKGLIKDVVKNATDTQALTAARAKADATYKEYQKKVQKVELFYKRLRWAFSIASPLACALALVVALVNMVIICAVYKQAVTNLGVQIAVARRLGLDEASELGAQMGLRVTMQLQRGDAAGGDSDENMQALGMQPESGAVQMFALVEAIKNHNIYMSIWFYGSIFSTVLIQMLLVSVVFTIAFTLLFHVNFWTFTFGYLIGFILALVITQLFTALVVFLLIGRLVAPGSKIRADAAWIAYFLIFSFSFIILGIMLALVRIIMILLSGIIMSCRIDRCLSALGKRLDPVYQGFLAMMKMQVEMGLVGTNEPPQVAALLQLEQPAAASKKPN